MPRPKVREIILRVVVSEDFVDPGDLCDDLMGYDDVVSVRHVASRDKVRDATDQECEEMCWDCEE